MKNCYKAIYIYDIIYKLKSDNFKIKEVTFAAVNFFLKKCKYYYFYFSEFNLY